MSESMNTMNRTDRPAVDGETLESLAKSDVARRMSLAIIVRRIDDIDGFADFAAAWLRGDEQFQHYQTATRMYAACRAHIESTLNK